MEGFTKKSRLRAWVLAGAGWVSEEVVLFSAATIAAGGLLSWGTQMSFVEAVCISVGLIGALGLAIRLMWRL